MSFKKFPWTDMHGFNLDWVIETVKSYTSKVDELGQEIQDISDTYETKENITNSRKLSPSGNFTGKWNGKTYTEFYGEVDSNSDTLQYLVKQFSDGRTGLVIDGGFFEETGINKNYDGGVF